MTSVITGDIIHSREHQPQKWLGPLKEVLAQVGDTPKEWEIYRGDSFQLEVKNVAEVLLIALHLKATMRSIKGLDIRVGIGIGDKTHTASKITESNGSAFVRSGQIFETLKNSTMAIKSPWNDLDESMNTCISLARLTMDHWTSKESKIIKQVIRQPELTQREIAKKMGITQGRISEALKRGGFGPIYNMHEHFKKLILQKV